MLFWNLKITPVVDFWRPETLLPLSHAVPGIEKCAFGTEAVWARKGSQYKILSSTGTALSIPLSFLLIWCSLVHRLTIALHVMRM